MSKVAILIDGGFFKKRFRSITKRFPEAEDVVDFAGKCCDGSEELFRIYYYDCPPYADRLVNPISKVNISSESRYKKTMSFLDKLKISPNVAYRKGELLYHGWQIQKHQLKKLLELSEPKIEAEHLSPNLTQKKVDMKIGLDIAWLSSKSIVDRIILVTADSDFVPAMKFARREGIQIIMVSMGVGLRPELKEHADFVRDVEIQ